MKNSKTSLDRNGNAIAYLRYILNLKIKFEMETSNYTLALKVGEKKKKFILNKISPKSFCAFSKIKKDVNRRDPVTLEKIVTIPKIDPAELVYFQHDFKIDCVHEKVINIDIKSAYATILYLDGYITKETFEYLATCTKPQRLQSVGMLASRKSTVFYDNGKIIDRKPTVSETSGIFFHAVKKTYEIMSRLKQICENKYLFTWVDGIYFLPDESVYFECMEELKYYNFDFSTELLKNFVVKNTNRKTRVTFDKKNKFGIYEPKQFELPKNPTNYKQEKKVFLINHKNVNQNETNKSKISR